MSIFRQSKNRKTRGFTLTEIMVGTAIIVAIGIVVGNWFFMQRSYQKRVLAMSDGQQNIRQACWRMQQELQIARTIIAPQLNPDKSLKSDSKIVFKGFNGDIVSYYFVEDSKELRRCVIPNGPGQPIIDATPIGKGLDKVVFTNHHQSNKLVGIFLESKGTFGLESAYLVND
jgi:prepilin-type N-terminal cleavage/methylation domain-containing protein